MEQQPSRSPSLSRTKLQQHLWQNCHNTCGKTATTPVAKLPHANQSRWDCLYTKYIEHMDGVYKTKCVYRDITGKSKLISQW